MNVQPQPAPSAPSQSPSQAPSGLKPAPKPGDEALFRKLVRDHQQRLYRFVVKHIGWGTDAEDITQQAFVEAAYSYATFKGESELSTWLYRGHGGGWVQLRAWRQGMRLHLQLRDGAPAFNPCHPRAVDTALPLHQRSPGGLGLMFVQSLCEEMRYQRLPAARPHRANRRFGHASAGAQSPASGDGINQLSLVYDLARARH